MNPTLYAHSSRPGKDGVPPVLPQTYQQHIEEVRRMAIHYAKQVGIYSPQWQALLKNVAQLSGEFHDLGKLDELNQPILGSDGSGSGLPVNHVDAGIAYLTTLTPNMDYLFGSYVIHSHHCGLKSWDKIKQQKSKAFRDFQVKEDSPLPISPAERSNQFLSEYLRLHRQTISPLPVVLSGKSIDLQKTQLFLRMALSCLADADHGDTSRHYQRKPIEKDESITPLRPTERLQLIDQYVQNLSNKSEKSERNRLRSEIYQACRLANPEQQMYECDSPVGTGKTTAVMAHLLKVAEERNLRRIFVILPFTNIIQQSADEYRKSLLFAHESPEQVIGEHHHKADFESPDSRQLTYLWKTPIVVTTAVQFFETLASNRPAALRKLHQVPGSAIFIDEAHAALPVDLIPQAWKWIRQLQEEWGCHFVLGSGSLLRFWQQEEFTDSPVTLPSLIPDSVRKKSHAAEQQRIAFHTIKKPLSLSELLSRIINAPGPRLVIVNTVQSAAVIAQKLQKDHDVLHISTSLTPHDREKTVTEVKRRLNDENASQNWILVATSCIEAGVNFSFQSGFRERCSLTSFLQTAGRVNRDNDYENSVIWDFSLLKEDGITEHPEFQKSAEVLEYMFTNNMIDPDHATCAITKAVRLEAEKKLKRVESLRKAEKSLNFPEVKKLFKVIEADTRTVLIKEELKERLSRREYVSFQEIQNHSVQIWSDKIDQLALQEIPGHSELYFWTLAYDSFLGYMAGVLATQDFIQNGGAIL